MHLSQNAAEMGLPCYFFSLSVCVYRDVQSDEPPLTEDDAIPANPDNEYGWEKLYAERVAMAYGRRCGMKVRIARFENCYDPERAAHAQSLDPSRYTGGGMVTFKLETLAETR